MNHEKVHDCIKEEKKTSDGEMSSVNLMVSAQSVCVFVFQIQSTAFKDVVIHNKLL